ncbi:DUF378 domain-containing protein [Candidatus Uhrbacteria bacterium CG10_big_fil_rev_8_21_14_0_10_48_11]|uniref:DUF378 domain-containing protein n=1 Tax=Candidatus Uhrbacteria bacterium CG10_big_fil_rev_8_21_14_0_10_48_11 TaxID=1975037 RepID=A0A2M8LE21_9BACT|nr:MAG: DUF378 domain-containing protein [Candidatus Uhrbacteria bacterium CG10_big_fil_rev_8_21_14_0_10_48_11]
MKNLHMITFLLLIVGGLNWLLFGLLGWDIGALFGGMGAVVSRVIYVLVGLSAVYEIAIHKATCKKCEAKGSMQQSTPQQPMNPGM